MIMALAAVPALALAQGRGAQPGQQDPQAREQRQEARQDRQEAQQREAQAQQQHQQAQQREQQAERREAGQQAMGQQATGGEARAVEQFREREGLFRRPNFDIEGRIASVEGNKITISREELPEAELTIASNTEIELDGDTASFAQLQPGQEVSAKFNLSGDQAVALEIQAERTDAQERRQEQREEQREQRQEQQERR
jgi:hypothetical protein